MDRTGRSPLSLATVCVGWLVVLAACGGDVFQAAEGTGGEADASNGDASNGAGGRSSVSTATTSGGGSVVGSGGAGGSAGRGGTAPGGRGGASSSGGSAGAAPGGRGGASGSAGATASGGAAGSVAGAAGSGGMNVIDAGPSPCSTALSFSVCVECCNDRNPAALPLFQGAAYGCACSDCYTLCSATLCDTNTSRPSGACVMCITQASDAAGCGNRFGNCSTDTTCAPYLACIQTCR